MGLSHYRLSVHSPLPPPSKNGASPHAFAHLGLQKWSLPTCICPFWATKMEPPHMYLPILGSKNGASPHVFAHFGLQKWSLPTCICPFWAPKMEPPHMYLPILGYKNGASPHVFAHF